MKAKEFFRSNAFKCIAVLLGIVLICSVFLTVCNALLHVSDEERLQRAINKIYGEEVTYVIHEGEYNKFDAAEIEAAYHVTDKNGYLIKSVGKNGYGGDVTCWVSVLMTEDKSNILGIGKVTVDSAPGESYLSKLDDSEINAFTTIYADGITFELGLDAFNQKGDQYIATGASYTMRAISNAVNGALDYVKANVLGTLIIAPSPYENWKYIQYINDKEENTYYTVNGTDVEYTVTTTNNGNAGQFIIEVTVNSDNKITAYAIKHNGSTNSYEEKMYKELETLMVGKAESDILALLGTDGNFDAGSMDQTLQTGATQSNFLCLYAALFATSNYEDALAAKGGNG